MSTPHAQKIKGRVIVTPSALTSVELPLTEDGAHIWRPFAPKADIRVELNRPGWTWHGHGYFDANFGTRALEADFKLLDLGGGSPCGTARPVSTTPRGGTARSCRWRSDLPRTGRSGPWRSRRRPV